CASPLSGVLGGRVLRLPEATRHLLEVVAVAGRPIRQADACKAAAWGAEELKELAWLRSARLLRRSGPAERQEIEIYHDRIRGTMLARPSPERLADTHRRLAAVLEAGGQGDPEVLAVHFQGAGEPGRAQGYYLQAAARAAQTLAFERAAQLYRLALELAGEQPPEEQRQLRVSLADALA